jgi:alkanesulfonate monooxygenase SsuD/methylene tetrahydromethanopterin reductase-like flavin-dependent oxidoreductase (luciferase family)
MKRAILYQPGGLDEPGLGEVVEQVRTAEDLGIDTVWCFPLASESGRLDGGAPELWLAALAEHTERIRLGWGRSGLLSPERPPLRVAEQLASLDVSSAGRVELALIADAARAEADASDDPEAPADSGWQEGYRMLVGMWGTAQFSWASSRFELGPVDVVPKPVQQPHPPLCLAGWSEGHARSAGQGGLGYLDVSGGDDDLLAIALQAYRAGRAGAAPEQLVSAAMFGVVGDLEPGSEASERLAGWDALGVDQAVARMGPEEGRRGGNLATIRFLGAGEYGLDGPLD